MLEAQYVIRLDSWGTYLWYHSHGSYAGREEVMSYTTKKEAKRFKSHIEAEKYICELPSWTRKDKYIVEELSMYEMCV